MARLVAYVTTKDSSWWLTIEEKRYGPYTTQALASRAGIDWAHKSGLNGHDTQVLVQGRDAKWQTEWTYGHDPYPPKG